MAQVNIDSLMNLAQNQEIDSVKSRLYFEIASGYYNQQNDSSYKYVRKSLAYARRCNSKKLLSKGNLKAAWLMFQSDKLDSALYYSDLVQKYASEIPDSTLIIEGFRIKGITYRRMDKKPEAIALLRICIQSAFKNKDTLLASKVLISLGNVFLEFNQYDSVLYYLLKSRQLSIQIGNTKGLIPVSLNIGNTYIKMGEYELAEKELKKCIILNKQFNQPYYMALLFTKMGMIYYLKEKFDTALIYYDSSMSFVKKLKMYGEQANLYINIGGTLSSMGKYDEALLIFDKLHQLDKSINNIDGELSRFINVGLVYERIGQFDQAQIYYDSALDLSRSSGNYNSMKQIYFNKFRDYELTRDYKKAFQYQTLYHEVKDSLLSLEKAKFIKDLEFKYDREKKDADILRLKHQALKKDAKLNTYQYQLTLGVIISGAIVLFLILLAYYQKQKAKKNRLIHDQEVKTLVAREKTAAARALLEGQEEERKRVALELHDGLGVMLSSVKMQFTNFIARHSQNDEVLHKAASVLDKAAVDVRRISHNMMPGVLTKFGLNISLEELIDELSETEGIEATVNISGDDKKLTDNIQIMIYRIIQELVNNTIKHAKASQVSLILEYGSEELNIIYSDNGIGFTPGLTGGSLGLKSIESRIRFLSGEVINESKPGKGSSYIIRIPYVATD